MTIIVQQKPPATTTNIIIKKPIQRGDKVIFQWNSNGSATNDKELQVDVTNVQTEPGLMKGWCVVSWSVDNDLP